MIEGINATIPFAANRAIDINLQHIISGLFGHIRIERRVIIAIENTVVIVVSVFVVADAIAIGVETLVRVVRESVFAVSNAVTIGIGLLRCSCGSYENIGNRNRNVLGVEIENQRPKGIATLRGHVDGVARCNIT